MTTQLELSPDWTELELRDRLVTSDPAAWREFHARYDRLIFRCVQRVTGRFRHLTCAEDVREVHAALLVNLTTRDMHRLRCYEPKRGMKLSSWIGLLATRAAWDHVRTLARQPRRADLADAAEIRCADDPEDRVAQRQRLALVHDAAAGFSSKDRTFLQLYFIDGLSPEEVAERMEISVKTVYSKKHKIRCRLSAAVAQHDMAAAA